MADLRQFINGVPKPTAASEDLKALTIWIPSRIVNALNAREFWTVNAARARRQRDAVCAAVLEKLGHAYQLRVGPAVPKHVEFHAFTVRPLDSDGLQAALKHCRDGLIDARILDDDRSQSGHRFAYRQSVADRKALRGVKITITVRA